MPATDLLDAWDGAPRSSSLRRDQYLLEALGVLPADREQESLSIGETTSLLFRLREALFGSEFTGVAACPACDQELEMTFDLSDVPSAEEIGVAHELSLSIDDCHVRFRLPKFADGIAASACATTLEARRFIFQRCLLSFQQGGVNKRAEDAGDALISAVAEHMADADPRGDLQFELSCPACRHEWITPFDIGLYLWNELDAWARSRIHEVHHLASAYGWTEREILSMSASRRKRYLDHVLA